MFLVFDPTKLPRTWTREQWREVWRWKRVTEKRLVEHTERQITEIICFGSTMPSEMRRDLIDRISNPPLLIGPYQ